MKKVISYSLILGLLGLVVFIKPLSIHFLDSFLSSLLETPVKTLQFKLFSLDLHASIKDEKNLAHVKINSLYPLQADVTYDGNINAFKVYQPLKAPGKLKGTVYYKDHLDINAELFTMGAKSKVHVVEKPKDWFVDANVSALDLATLQAENNISVDVEGKVDIFVNFHTNGDSVINLRSKGAHVYKQEYNNIHFQIKDVKDHIKAFALFTAPNMDYKGIWFNYNEKTKHFDGKVNLRLHTADNDILLNLEGEHNATKLKADVFAKLSASKIEIKDIEYDLNTSETSALININMKEMQRHTVLAKLTGISLQGDFKAKAKLLYKNKNLEADLQSQSLGGNLSLKYNKGFIWKAKALSLKKLSYIFKLEQDLESKFDTSGSFKDDKLLAHIQTDLLSIDKTKIRDINLSALGSLKNLNIQAKAKTDYAEVKEARLKLKDFSHADLRAKLTTPYTHDTILLDVNSSYINSVGKMNLEAGSKDFHLEIPKLTYENAKLKAGYKLKVQPQLSTLKDTMNFAGKFSYDKKFMFSVSTKDFGKKINLSLKGKKIKLYSKNLRLENVLSQLQQAPYAKGKLDFEVNGDSEKLNFTLKSKKLSLNKKETGLDENLSLNLNGYLTKKEVYIWPKLVDKNLKSSKGLVFLNFKEKQLNVKLPLELSKKKKRLKLVLDSRLDFKNESKGHISLLHENDSIGLSNLIYSKGNMHSDFGLSINNLSLYAPLFDQELYGPFDMRGSVNYSNNKADVNVSTKSLGGHLNISLQDRLLDIQLHQLLAPKIGNLLGGQANSQIGTLNGQIKYNLKDKKGDMELAAKDITIQGIDIDKSLKEMRDVLGLDIFAMGNSLITKGLSASDDVNLSTLVKQVEVDVKITPELIISKDIALSTQYSRFAVDMSLKHDGDIKDFEVAILDPKGCAILKQKLKGNIKNPDLVNTKGTAVVILGQAPKEILKTGGRLVHAGAGLIDSVASFVWKKGLRQDSDVTLVDDSLTAGTNVFSSSAEMVVSGKCKAFYVGKVKHPR